MPVRSIFCAALLLLGLCTSAAATVPACPAGQHRVCLLLCFCAPGSAEDSGPLLEDIGRMAASGLEQWIRQSHQQLLAKGGLQPIPLHIRAHLEPYYDLQVLDSARYRVGDDSQFSTANTLLYNPDISAVTLVDIIVFRHAEDAENNVALWAHELLHVQQYQEWGVAEFARRYSGDADAVEAPAYALQRQVARALREGARASAAPGP